ncbi:hypothetical protein HaLaN_25287, partial [Haematococcus lacustris]
MMVGHQGRGKGEGCRSWALRLELQLLEGPAAALAQTFWVELRRPVPGRPAFLVLRSCFDAGCARSWAVGQRCQ